jgi:hypothetical protein
MNVVNHRWEYPLRSPDNFASNLVNRQLLVKLEGERGRGGEGRGGERVSSIANGCWALVGRSKLRKT